MEKKVIATIQDYIKNAPPQAQEKLKELYHLLKMVVPDAKEEIKWGSPVFIDKRILFSFTAFKAHMNFMPTQLSMKPFEQELKQFKTGKDTIQFPYDQPLPKSLITKIAAHRTKDVKENDALWMYKK
jgi:uncharacterized protein YdhG (YjbR/CyaY superfamily)